MIPNLCWIRIQDQWMLEWIVGDTSWQLWDVE